MTLLRWMTVLLMAASGVACSATVAGPRTGDGGRDGPHAVDVGVDRMSPKETGTEPASAKDAGAGHSSSKDADLADAKPADGSPNDAGAKDARTKDAGRKDAPARDAGTKDATTKDATSKDASKREATSMDASPGDGGSHDAGYGDAADAGADGAPSMATRISISPLTLVPPFSTSIQDYYVRCQAGTNMLTVTMTAAPGSTIALIEPTTTPPSTDASTTLPVTESEAIVVGVTTSGITEPYWIRCLPHDFPRLQMMPYPEAGTPTPGYYLVGNLVVAPGDQGYAMLLDGNGVPLWYHTTQTGGGAVDVDNIVPGTISYVPDIGATFASSSGQFELHDLEAGTTTYVEPDGMPLDEHELQVLPNGHFLVFANPIIAGVDLTGLDNFGPDASIIGCDIQEIDGAGALVWEWDATDHFDPVQDSIWPEGMSLAGVMIVDVFHCNSIDIDTNGNLLVSARQMDSIFMVSKGTGAVLWKMGGSTYTKEGAPYIAIENDPMTEFYGQHDARLLPEGGISMFDDQTGHAGPARAVIYSLDVDAGTATMAWQYQGTRVSYAMGSFRMQADGSRVIGWGMNGIQTLAFTELDVDGNDLLDFHFPDGTQSYRAIKIPTSAFDIDLLRATAGKN